jgi:hypothetical protein
MQGHEYAADFLVLWTPLLRGVLWQTIDEHHSDSLRKLPFIANYNKSQDIYYSVIDVKGTFAGKHNNSAVTFGLNQKWVWARHNIYVQKAITYPRLSKSGTYLPSTSLFMTTFVPERFLLTDKDMTPRAIHYPCRSIDKYIIDVLKLV